MTSSPSRYLNRANRLLLYVTSFIGFLLCLTIGLGYFTDLGGADSPGCRLIYMVPSYARIQGMDSMASRYASKYSLYLYREVDKDAIPPDHYHDTDNMSFLNGIPVLFIPGNAGSYKQVRSIAAEAANLYYGNDDFPKEDISNPNTQNFDFFAADFNEDFTAFHGQTIMEQADFLNEAIKLILSLYADKQNPPSSVIIIGHSMGGIVARVMITLPSYVEDSVKAMITLASPHAAAPLTFDGDILKVYSLIDKFWYQGFENVSQIANRRVKDLSLISITGGGLDATLPADYTTLSHLVPPLNGFTVFTTGMPTVWSPIDHLAIVWCGQLRRLVAKSLMEIADSTSPDRVYPLEKRMHIFRRLYLSGFEDYAAQDTIAYASSLENSKLEALNLKIDTELIDSYSLDKDNRMKLTTAHKGKKFNLFSIPTDSQPIFSMLSSLKFSPMKSSTLPSMSLLVCNNKDNLKFKTSTMLDFTNAGSDRYTSLYCIDISQDLNLVPRSSIADVSLLADSSFLGSHSPYYGIQLNSSVLSRFDTVLIVSDTEQLAKDEKDFLIAETSLEKDSTGTLGNNQLLSLLLQGADISLPSNRPLTFNIQIPSAWSSLLAYKVRLQYSSESDSRSSFSPFIRQWSDEPFETKWYINLEGQPTLSLSSHNIAPYTPFKIDKKNSGLNLQLWSDNNISDGPLDIYLSIDYFMSLRLLVLRYRLTVVSFCAMICLVVLLRQLIVYKYLKVFPDFQTAFQTVTSGPLLISTTIILVSLNWLVKSKVINMILSILDPVTLRDRELPSYVFENGFQLNKLYLGLEEDSLFLLPMVFYCISVFIVLLTYKLILVLLFILGAIVSFYFRLRGKYASEASTTTTTAASSASSTQIKDFEDKDVVISIGQKLKGFHSTRRRLVVTLLTLILVAYQIPYQVVTVICCAGQGINCIRLFAILKSRQDSNIKYGQQLLNFQVSLFLVMLWVMPVDIPIVIVYVHNLAIKWQTAFSSHHNILSILPIMLLLERNVEMTNTVANGGMPSLAWIICSFRVTMGIIIYFIGYCLIYGTRHTFWLHHLLNVTCAWFLWLQVYQYESEKQ